MNYKSDIGELHYNNDENAGVHAVTQIDWLTDKAETLPDHNISYTPFNKVKHITQGPNYKDTMHFAYGPEYNRKTMTYKKDGDLQYTRHYSGNCEKTTFANGNERKVYYISGGDGLAAAWVKENGATNLYYIHTDHLGSICAITDKDQNIVANYSFDAWGNRRDPETWELTDNWDASFTSRGFTGHEHIDEFGLINMNGRVYDPTIGQFLSPDNHVQLPDASLGFNRYSYALNNPLVYTDPDGEWIGLAIGLVVGGYIGGVVAEEGELNPGEWKWDQNTWKGIAVGGISGALLGGAVELVIAGELELSIAAATPAGKASVDIANSDMELHWSTAAGGGGSLSLTEEEYDRSLTAGPGGINSSEPRPINYKGTPEEILYGIVDWTEYLYINSWSTTKHPSGRHYDIREVFYNLPQQKIGGYGPRGTNYGKMLETDKAGVYSIAFPDLSYNRGHPIMTVRHWEESSNVFVIRYAGRLKRDNMATFKFYKEDYYDALRQKLFGY